jgi:hypothetical protein
MWQPILSIFRNGSYAQLDQSVAGFVRIAGIMPEASGFASYGFIWMVFMLELWLRDIMPRRTGPAAALMCLVLVASTSSTAYVSLGVYGVLLFVRSLINHKLMRFDKLLWLAGSAMVAATAGCLLVLLNPTLADTLAALLRHFTVDKADSTSGQQRLFWAQQGINAFKVSYGLGIGAGSFRSSSVITAVLGSMGVIGIIAYFGNLLHVLRPFSASTFGAPAHPVDAVGIAASWTAFAALIPASIGAPSPDPGFNMAFFTGVALGLRATRRGQARPATRIRMRRNERHISLGCRRALSAAC